MDAPAEAVRVRPYERADRAGFAELVGTVLAEYGFCVDPILESDLTDPEGTYNALWVAAQAGRVVGSVAIRELEGGATAELKRMYLHPDWRGRGLGRELLGQALRWAGERGCRAVVLDTSEAMTAARALYESAGFVRTGTRTETGVHDSRCEILYRLELHRP